MAQLPNDLYTIELGATLWRPVVGHNAQKIDPSLNYPEAITCGYAVSCTVGQLARRIIGLQQFRVKKARCTVLTAGTTGTMTIDVKDDGVSIFSTVLSVLSGATEDNDSAVLISDPTVGADSILTVHVLAAHTTPAVGLAVSLNIEMLPNP